MAENRVIAIHQVSADVAQDLTPEEIAAHYGGNVTVVPLSPHDVNAFGRAPVNTLDFEIREGPKSGIYTQADGSAPK